jgi:hypothetical protein
MESRRLRSRKAVVRHTTSIFIASWYGSVFSLFADKTREQRLLRLFRQQFNLDSSFCVPSIFSLRAAIRLREISLSES